MPRRLHIGVVGEAGEASRIAGLCAGLIDGGEIKINREITLADILIVNGDGALAEEILPSLAKDGLLVVNLDERDLPAHLGGARAKVITYGFGGKACVTVSGVTEGNIQVCVQRSLPVFGSDTVVEEQEFPVRAETSDASDIPDERGISRVLAAVTAALVAGAATPLKT